MGNCGMVMLPSVGHHPEDVVAGVAVVEASNIINAAKKIGSDGSSF